VTDYEDGRERILGLFISDGTRLAYVRTTLSRRHSASNTISGREILASLGGAPFCAARGMTFANGDARQVSVVAVEKPSPKWAEAKTPSGTCLQRKNESAPDSFESGDALVEQSSPKTAHNHSTFCSALAPS